jgi:hypothetical protein
MSLVWFLDSNINVQSRYEKCWLPLAAGYVGTEESALLPPLDVQWVWHCHCLSPV